MNFSKKNQVSTCPYASGCVAEVNLKRLIFSDC